MKMLGILAEKEEQDMVKITLNGKEISAEDIRLSDDIIKIIINSLVN